MTNRRKPSSISAIQGRPEGIAKMLYPIAAFLLAAAMIFISSAPAFALTGEVYDPKTLPELQPESSSWANVELTKAKQAGLLVDGLGGNYKMDISRSQFCALVVNMVEKTTGTKLSTPNASPFNDASELWILKANAAGIVSGISSTTFDPSASITREQIASMLHRAMTYVEKETGRTKLTQGGTLSAYSDAGQVSGWAKDAVTALSENGIMKGTSATALNPKGTTTIEQAVLLTLRVYDLYA